MEFINRFDVLVSDEIQYLNDYETDKAFMDYARQAIPYLQGRISEYPFDDIKQIEPYIEIFENNFFLLYPKFGADIYYDGFNIAVYFQFVCDKRRREYKKGKDILGRFGKVIGKNKDTLEYDVVYNNDIRGFTQTGVYFIKPNVPKYWLKAVAYFDLQEVRHAFKNASEEDTIVLLGKNY